MQQGLHKKISLIILFWLSFSALSQAEPDWAAFTFDNDLFFNSDNGYTNNFSYSWFELSDGDKRFAPEVLLSPLGWTINRKQYHRMIAARTVSQIMMTPGDITLENPSENDLPYSGLLVYYSNFIGIADDYADKIGVSVGVVGPLAGGEETQKFLHRLVNTDQPQGWDTQLENEVVFMLLRSRIFRSWVSDQDNADFLSAFHGRLGTITSSISTSFMFRYGTGLKQTFASPLLTLERTLNPIAINSSWYLFFGLDFSYVFNQIFTDGNTFTDSRSVDVKNEQISVAAGIAWSRERFSLTFSFNDLSLIEDRPPGINTEYTRFGSVTAGWKY